MEEDGWLVNVEGMINFALVPPLPSLKHHGSLDMVSMPTMHQKEYEQNLLSIG